MNDPIRGWDRRQWVGETQRSGAYADQPEQLTDLVPWNLAQWVGEGQGASAGTHVRPSAHDPRSGFSGGGRPDTGGQRWAIGYPRPEIPQGTDVAMEEADASEDAAASESAA